MYPTHKWLRLLRRPARLTLATKTSTATSLLFLVTILAIGTAALHSFRQQLVNVMVADQNTLVVRIADNLDQKLLALQRALTASASEISTADIASSDAAQHYLDTNTGLFATVDRSTFLFTEDGIELAERPYRANRRGSNALERAYIRDTISTRKPVISQPFVTNVGDSNMVLVATAPVFARDGRMVAILTGSLGLTRPGMLGGIAKTIIGQTGYLYIVTADGRLIMHPDRTRLSQRAFAPRANALFERALKGFEGTDETVDADGRAAIVTYRRVPTSNWIVAAVYPKDEAFLAIQDLTWRFLELLLLGCVLVVASIWVLTRYLMRPLVLLTEHLRNYSAHADRIAPLTGRTGSGEIRALRNAFNRLAARLHQREDALIETMQKYQLITENSTDLITKHTLDGTIGYASPVSASILGITHTELIGHSLCEFVHPEDFVAVRSAVAEAVKTKSLETVMYRA
ncbi:MAG: cache domain-containing protein, partial [Casimicrobiaceae bacterium]